MQPPLHTEVGVKESFADSKRMSPPKELCTAGPSVVDPTVAQDFLPPIVNCTSSHGSERPPSVVCYGGPGSPTWGPMKPCPAPTLQSGVPPVPIAVYAHVTACTRDVQSAHGVFMVLYDDVRWGDVAGPGVPSPR